MDNGLVPTSDETFKKMVCVLILVVVDNGLVPGKYNNRTGEFEKS